MLKKKVLFFLSGVLIYTNMLCASDDDGVSFRIHHQYQSPRALGMGDAFVAVANDYSALFYNPAGLARREDSETNLSISAGITPTAITLAKDINDASKLSTESAQQSKIIEILEKAYGESYGLRAEVFSGIMVHPNWGIGIIPADLTLDLSVHRQVGPAINDTTYLDSTIAYGYGTNVHWFSNAHTSVGATLKFVNRGYVSKPLNIIELAADPTLVKKEDLKEGYTVDADLGMLYTPELPSSGFFSAFRYARPTFGLVARNVAETGFGQSLKLFQKTKTDKPEKLYRVLDIGSRWEYPSFWIFTGRGVLDIRDIGHPLFNWKKASHIGFEFDWSMSSWWRGQYRVGLSEGYWTAGASALFTIFNLDLVSYAEDVGTYSSPKANRVYLAKLNLNF
ncbi:MAG: hypothetical protein ACOYOK_00455 [Pseudobdellovibrionaceae bacterium]